MERSKKIQVVSASALDVVPQEEEIKTGRNLIELITLAEKKKGGEKIKKEVVERGEKAVGARMTSEAMAELEEERRLAGEVLRQRDAAQVTLWLVSRITPSSFVVQQLWPSN